MDLLNRLYYDAKTGFQSANKLYKKAKEIDSKITLTCFVLLIDGLKAYNVFSKCMMRNCGAFPLHPFCPISNLN